MSGAIHLDFSASWRAEILSARPLILPQRSFIYPAQAEEVEKGALEILVHPRETATEALPFLATCALGFADRSVPSGVWSCPHPEELCAVAGGYAYLIRTAEPARFTFLSMRPVLAVHAAAAAGLLLFASHRTLLAWGADGQAWETESLSDEGITVTGVRIDTLEGMGWDMRTDKEVPFRLDLRTGKRT